MKKDLDWQRVMAIAWYAIRPESLFIDKSVSENFPATSVAANLPDASAPKELAVRTVQRLCAPNRLI
jgi:hypothetical protein